MTVVAERLLPCAVGWRAGARERGGFHLRRRPLIALLHPPGSLAAAPCRLAAHATPLPPIVRRPGCIIAFSVHVLLYGWPASCRALNPLWSGVRQAPTALCSLLPLRPPPHTHMHTPCPQLAIALIPWPRGCSPLTSPQTNTRISSMNAPAGRRSAPPPHAYPRQPGPLFVTLPAKLGRGHVTAAAQASCSAAGTWGAALDLWRHHWRRLARC